MDFKKEALKKHKEWCGKIGISSKSKINSLDDLSIAYTPGVAEPCKEIEKDKTKLYDYTIKNNTVAVITDGSAVLGLGNIGADASLPVMEGKAVLFKEFAGVNAFPICIKTQDVEEFIKTVKLISTSFGGINLEDISAPRCFEIEERLKKELDIPVFHDDQHGTAIVVLAGIINSLKIIKKEPTDMKVIVNGAGAAGTAIAKLLIKYGFKNVIMCDKQGILNNTNSLDSHKQNLVKITNPNNETGTLKEAIKNADIFIGVSAPNIVNEEMIKSMNKDSIVFAMANPVPEIMPDIAKKAGARIVGTGRSDFPNQVNNVLVFPGIFKGALTVRKQITDDIKIAAANAIADLVDNKILDENHILPKALDKSISEKVCNAVIKYYEEIK